jgi:hypothetical protein
LLFEQVFVFRFERLDVCANFIERTCRLQFVEMTREGNLVPNLRRGFVDPASGV